VIESINKKLEYARVELLDMGLRGNTLLHLRANAKTLEVIDEVSYEVYSLLVEQLKAMTFAALPDDMIDEDDKVDDSQPLPKLLEERYGESRHTDTKLQTKLLDDTLDKRLIKISTEATTYYQEQGIDILYLALGFLTWYEDKNSDIARKAPLILVPVALERSSAKERFKLRYTQADLGPNLSLEAKLKMDFQITLPEFGEELDFERYLTNVTESISKQARWRVNVNDIKLGFFSFGKFQMYQDLAPDNWPADKQPALHKVLKALLGDGFGGESASDGDLSDSQGDVEGSSPDLVDLHFVKDADSSQTEAVMAVKRGANLVIQGPPGTGKSQTITNIISESLADGKRILFVAEKMAALDVVKRRLDESHLGDAVLELHSHKSNKKAVMDELKRTLELGRPKVQDRSAEKQRYRYLCEQLDNYSNDVNTEVLNSGTTYIDALGHHLQLNKSCSELSLPVLDFVAMREWSNNDFNEACSMVTGLADHLKNMGVPAKNAFANSTLEDFSPIEQNKLSTLLIDTQLLLEKCKNEAALIAQEMNLQLPATITDIQVLHRAATRALNAPHLQGLSLTTDDWQLRRDQIRELIVAGSETSKLKEKRADQLIEQAWHGDVLLTRQVWVTTGRKWWRFMSGAFRQARSKLTGVLKGDLPKNTDDCIAILDDILQFQTMNKTFVDHQQLGQSLFGAQWQNEKSDWQVLDKLTTWVIELYDDVGKGELPAGLLRFLEGGPELDDWVLRLGVLAEDTRKLELYIEKTIKQLATTLPQQGEKTVQDSELTIISDSLQSWHSRTDELYQMTRYNRLRNTFKRPDLEQLGELSFEWSLAPELLLTTLKMAWYSGLVEEAYKERKSLRQFDRVSQENMILEFKHLDKQLFHNAQESLIDQLFTQTPSASGAGEMAIIRREMNKKRRHLPIRKLISQAGRAIQQFKPVFMMSPMSVATYLEQGAVEFDLVVFDEASQVKVVDALGPILRGNQVVVVGDTKQMPPTDFFSKAVELDDDEADESMTADIESILSMFLAQAAPEAMLRWHYRSRHDSLIAVSNQEFYEGKLMIFPSPGVNPEAIGLKLRHLPETIYERGGSRTNPGEARVVAEAVMEHARTQKQKQLTLGVVAFSTAQRDCIILEVERLRREDPSCEDFFNAERNDGEVFFVKNLENVQGDERDVIFISIAYGRTASGKVSTSFGPVNRAGGERRLNVLITRARLGMEVFCNFTADDLKTDSTSPFGLRSLKNFIKYAETGQLERPTETGKDTDSPFEDEVISAIRQLGYAVEPQVGSAGFFIDIAVRDPLKPGRYILAVECDGATYHSSANARDRDRLRQDVLEGLGWRFHRIWSTDWFRNPHKETERLKDSIKSAIEYYTQLDESGVVSPAQDINVAVSKPQKIKRDVTSSQSTVTTKAYTLAPRYLGIAQQAEIHDLNLDVIHAAINKVLAIEGPIHVKEAARRIADSAGYSRVGQRMMNHVRKALDKGHKESLFHVDKEFIYHDHKKEVSIRDRSALPSTLKKIDLVPYEEIQAALMDTVKMAFSLPKQDAESEAMSLMGFQRTTAKSRESIGLVINNLIKTRQLKEQGELISLP
jgi:very-short-patch-repair endonuclease/DNA polymerase III delta prime subunit